MDRHYSYTFRVPDTEGQNCWRYDCLLPSTLDSDVEVAFLRWLNGLPQERVIREQATWYRNQDF